MPRPKTHLTASFISAFILASSATLPAQNADELNKLFSEAQAAFVAQDFNGASTKLETLIEQSKSMPNAPHEMLRFSLGLAYFQANKFAEAEKAFSECAAQFPNGTYTSRCYLGLGRALLGQKDPAKTEAAIEAFTRAANDPQLRAEAGLLLGRVYTELDKPDDALRIFRSLMGSEVRTPQQTTAAVEAIEVLAQTDNINDLILYLDRLITQPGIRNAIAWYSNEVIVRADQLTGEQKYDAALAIYRSIPPRRQILSIQRTSLAQQQAKLTELEKKAEAEAKLPIDKQPNQSSAETAARLKNTITATEAALTAISGKEDLDPAILLRRGRCLYYLNRNQEALICFKYIQDKFPNATDAQHAAYSEIVILNRLKKIEEMQSAAAEFVKKYPDSERREQVAMLAGDGLAQAGKWEEVIRFYEKLEQDFPNSQQKPYFLYYQGVAMFQLNEFADAEKKFQEIVDKHPDSNLVETALYRIAMAHFLTNDSKGTTEAFNQYLTRFPLGDYAGEAYYRLAFIDNNNRTKDLSDKIIKDLTGFLAQKPDDIAAASIYSLIGDVYAQKKKDAEGKPMTDKALEAYLNAAEIATSEQILTYVIDAATGIMQANKDWAGIAKLHSDLYAKQPNSSMGIRSAAWVAKMKIRDGKKEEAIAFLSEALKANIADPSNEQVEFLLDELVKTFVPPGKAAREANVEALCDDLAATIQKAAEGKENQTTNARIYYARAKLAQALRDSQRAAIYMRGIATDETDPAALSPVLLYVAADLHMKSGDYDRAESMYQRLTDRYKESVFADAGPAGLGQVALARGKYEEALAMFDDILNNSGGTSRYGDVMIGKLKALLGVGKLQEAEELSQKLLGDKRTFRGAPTGEILITTGDIHRKRSEKLGGEEKRNALAQAHAFYQKAYVAYQAYPDICAEGYWQAYEVAKLLGDNELAQSTLKTLAEHPKLQKTERARKAKELNP
ncbi:MAG: tetratricopeptide repeat protein [Luteolibacter sp.]